MKTDYQKISEIILKVVDCNKETVTYEYVKPEKKAGQTITFSISVE